MESHIKKDLIHVIDVAMILLEKDEGDNLKDLSNHTIHNASIYHDEASVTLAVIIYALSKLSLRFKINKVKVLNDLLNLKGALISSDYNSYIDAQKKLLHYINSIDLKFSNYVEQILIEAQVKKAWKLYDHGLSIETTANFLGVSQWDLLNYIGNTKITELSNNKTDIKSRLKFTRSLFV